VVKEANQENLDREDLLDLLVPWDQLDPMVSLDNPDSLV